MTGRELAVFAISLIGHPYMYGVNGKVITEALIQAKKAQYPSNYADSQYDINKWGMTKIQKLRSEIGQVAYDCSSITDCFTGLDKSANGWISYCSTKGPISTIPEIVGLIVHSDGHMGVYIGGGYVIEARGTFYGVVKTRLSDRPWVNWGQSTRH